MRIASFILLTLGLSSCKTVSVTTPFASSCIFTKTMVLHDSLQNYPVTNDSSRIYFWSITQRKIHVSTFDSLVNALCAENYSIEEAWYPLDNRCMNPLPLDPYIILKKADSTILGQ